MSHDVDHDMHRLDNLLEDLYYARRDTKHLIRAMFNKLRERIDYLEARNESTGV